MMTGPIRVLLVDDDPLVLSGLKMMLGGAEQVQVLTTFDADELVLRALQAGATGLLKDSAPADIVAAIQAVHAGDGSLSPAIARRLIRLVAGDPDTAARQQQARRRLALAHPPRAPGSDCHRPRARQRRNRRPAAHEPSHRQGTRTLLAKLAAENRVQIALLVQDAATPRPYGPR